MNKGNIFMCYSITGLVFTTAANIELPSYFSFDCPIEFELPHIFCLDK